uniref:Uncharacterized protein n=1 Tax=Ditylenchus dipsaci TaxID=166011 RepID=A0A915D466_9BILA
MNKLVLKSQTLGHSNTIRNLAPSQQLGQSTAKQPQIRRVPSMNSAELPPLAYEKKRSSLTSTERGPIN